MARAGSTKKKSADQPSLLGARAEIHVVLALLVGPYEDIPIEELVNRLRSADTMLATCSIHFERYLRQVAAEKAKLNAVQALAKKPVRGRLPKTATRK